jgi:methyl-accepting chemotaxis protein
MARISTRTTLPKLALKLGTKGVLLAGLLVVLTTAGVVFAAYQSLSSNFTSRARSDIEINLRTLALAFAETYGNARVTYKDGNVARVEMAEMPTFKDHAIVDRAVAYVGGNATVFVHDPATDQFVRRTTNLKKEDGSRAVGTQLAADHPGQGPAVAARRRLQGSGRAVRHELLHGLSAGFRFCGKDDRDPLRRNSHRPL